MRSRYVQSIILHCTFQPRLIKGCTVQMACANALPTSSSESSACNATAESSENGAIPSQGRADGGEVKARPVPDLIPILPNRRLSYTREEKLHVLKFYRESGDSKHKTSQRFGVPKSSLYRWLEIEDEIESSREGSKRVGRGGSKGFWQDAERNLAAETTELRQNGRKLMLDATALPTTSTCTQNLACTCSAMYTAEPIRSFENYTIPGQGSHGNSKTRPVPDLIPILPNRRISYTREEKLYILKYYHESGESKYGTCQRFGVPKSSLYRWIECEDDIKKSKEGSKKIRAGGRRVFWPDVEEKLAAEFKELRQKGRKLMLDWFKIRAYELMNEMHPDVNFRFSQGWFDRFKARNNITCH